MTPAYVYRHRVTLDETNLVGNVYFAQYAHWQGHCREHFLADHAPAVLAGLADGLALVTTGCDIEFYAEAHALDEIEVRMELDRVSGHRIGMAFEYVRTGSVSARPAAPELLARGHQTVAVMRREETGLRPAPLPEQLAAALARYAPGGQLAGRGT